MRQPPCLPREKTFEVLKEQCAGKVPFSATPRSLTPILSAVRGSDLQDSFAQVSWSSGGGSPQPSVYLEVLAKVLRGVHTPEFRLTGV